MEALIIIIPIYVVIFIIYGISNIKKYLLLTGIVTLPFRTTYMLFDVGSRTGWTSGVMITLSDISFISLFFYLLIKQKKMNKASNKISRSIIYFIGACFLSLMNSTWHMVTLYQVFLVSQVAFLYYFVLVNSIETEEEIRFVIMCLTISLLFQGILGNLQYFTGESFDLFSTGPGVSGFRIINEETNIIRVYGTIGKPNGFGAYLTPLLLLNVSLLLGIKQHRNARFTAVILGNLALIFSFSRGAWVSYFLSLLLLILVAMKNGIVKRKTVAAGLMIAIIITIAFYPVLETRIRDYDNQTAISRIPLMKIAFNMAHKHPIVGVGTNTFRNVIRSYTTTPDLQNIYLNVVHNQYLLVLAEAGIIGLISFLWLIISIYKESLIIIKQKKNRFLYFLGFGIRFSIVSVSIHMMVDIYSSHLHLANLFILTSLLIASNNLLTNSDAKTIQKALT